MDTEFVHSLTSTRAISFNHNSSPANHSRVVTEPNLIRNVCVVENTLTSQVGGEVRVLTSPGGAPAEMLTQRCIRCAMAGYREAGRHSCVHTCAAGSERAAGCSSGHWGPLRTGPVPLPPPHPRAPAPSSTPASVGGVVLGAWRSDIRHILGNMFGYVMSDSDLLTS